MQEYLIAYTFTSWQMGSGRTFGTTNGPVTQKVIEAWEKAIATQNGFERVAIQSFQPIASAPEK